MIMQVARALVVLCTPPMMPQYTSVLFLAFFAWLAQAVAASSRWPLNQWPVDTWLESHDTGAELLGRASYFGCTSSAFACSYATTVQDPRRDSICYTCMGFCGAGSLKKWNLQGPMYRVISFGYGLAAPACYFHKTSGGSGDPVQQQRQLQGESPVTEDAVITVPARSLANTAVASGLVGTPDDHAYGAQKDCDGTSHSSLSSSDETEQGSKSDVVQSSSEKPSLFRLVAGDATEHHFSAWVAEGGVGEVTSSAQTTKEGIVAMLCFFVATVVTWWLG